MESVEGPKPGSGSDESFEERFQTCKENVERRSGVAMSPYSAFLLHRELFQAIGPTPTPSKKPVERS